MIIIADGGSTKTDWRLIRKDEATLSAQCGSINPFHLNASEISSQVSTINFPIENKNIEAIYYYGAGVSGDKAILKIEDALKDKFGKHCRIHVGDDLLAASRALFGDSEGIACILGTGSNSGHFRNGYIIEKIPALGFVLGDEGSGTDLGKRFLNGYFKRSFPAELIDIIEKKEHLKMTRVLEEVYRNPSAAKNLAEYTKIIIKYIDHKAIQDLIKNAFDDFIVKNVSKYSQYHSLKIGFVGSIAFHFRDILEEVMENRNLKKGIYISAPIEELVAYHKKAWK